MGNIMVNSQNKAYVVNGMALMYSALPVGAVAMEYLRSFGNCVIDTGVGTGADTSTLSVKGKFTLRPTASGQWFLHAGLSNGNPIGLQSSGTTGARLQSGDGSDHEISGAAIGSGNTFEIVNGVIKFAGDSQTLASSTLSSDISLLATDTPSDYGMGVIGPVKISIGGVTVRDFQPCLDPLGIPALYDMVSGGFFYNTGSGTLQYGNDTNFSVIGSMGSTLQGMAIYNDIVVRMANNTTSTTHHVYRMTSNSVTEIATFTLSGTGHSNALQFAGTLESGQTLPYMSVSDITDKCYVLSFDSSYQATIVQTIGIGITAQVLKDDQNYVWANINTGDGHRKFQKYRQVLVSEGSSVTLSSADLLDEWTAYGDWPSANYTAQGWKVKNGKLYFLYGGDTNNNKIKGVSVYDTTTHKCIDQYDFTDWWFTEPEDLDFYNGEMVVCPYSGAAYFVQKRNIRVPEGYTQVQYLGINGAGNIDLAMNGSEATDAFELDAALTTVTAQMRLIASTSTSCQMYVNGSLALGYSHANNWKGLSGVTFDTSRHRVGVDYVNKKSWFDGTYGTFTGTATQTTGNAYLGVGLQYSSQPRLRANVYGVKVWRNNYIVRDIIFLRDGNNTPYAYDMVRGVFRTITGTVTLGPDWV